MSDPRKCLKCGGNLADHEQLICGSCFLKMPFSLRLEWKAAVKSRNQKSQDRCIAKVRKFVQLTNKSQAVDEDLALGQARIREMESEPVTEPLPVVQQGDEVVVMHGDNRDLNDPHMIGFDIGVVGYGSTDSLVHVQQHGNFKRSTGRSTKYRNISIGVDAGVIARVKQAKEEARKRGLEQFEQTRREREADPRTPLLDFFRDGSPCWHKLTLEQLQQIKGWLDA